MMAKRCAFVTLFLVLSVLGTPGSPRAGQRLPQQQPPQQPQQAPVPRIPSNGNPLGIGGPLDDEPSVKVDPKQQLKEAQKKLTADVQHLLQLATELKDESDKTKETDVLSLPLIRKADEIEKLAKQIKDLARAN